VLGLADCAAHHLCLLAFLRRDFYHENYLRSPQPTYEELLERAAAAPLDAERLCELVRLAPAARSVADLIAARARSGTP
jgi:hypothetical protein